MKDINGFSLLEIIIAAALTMVLLTSLLGFFWQTYTFWQKTTQVNSEYQEVLFALDNIKEAVYGGTLQPGSSGEILKLKDEQDRDVLFYLKNKKVCMYKNATFYLTTKQVPLQGLVFKYGPPQTLSSVHFELLSGKRFTFYL